MNIILNFKHETRWNHFFSLRFLLFFACFSKFWNPKFSLFFQNKPIQLILPHIKNYIFKKQVDWRKKNNKSNKIINILIYIIYTSNWHLTESEFSWCKHLFKSPQSLYLWMFWSRRCFWVAFIQSVLVIFGHVYEKSQNFFFNNINLFKMLGHQLQNRNTKL